MNVRRSLWMAFILGASGSVLPVASNARAEELLCMGWGPGSSDTQIDRLGFFAIRCVTNRKPDGTSGDHGGELVGSLIVCRLNSEQGVKWCDLTQNPESDLLYGIAQVEPTYHSCQHVKCEGNLIPRTGGIGTTLVGIRERTEEMDEYFTWVPGQSFFMCSCYDND